MRYLRSLAIVVAISATVLGCSTGSPAGDPTAVVKEALQLVEQGQFDDVAALACDSKRDDLVGALGLDEAVPEGMSGLVDPTRFAPALAIDTDGLTVTEKGRAADAATVHLAGTLNITVDKAKLTTLLNEMGLTLDQQFLDTIVSGIISRLEDGVPIDQDLNVVNENGVWKIC